jgi:hypothetical protein
VPNESVNEAQQLSVQQLAQISDAALDSAYGYGRSSPGNTFGWQANLKSAAFAKQMIDRGVTDIEAISDAIHKGWNVTAQAFVKNPDQFDDSKTMAPEKLQAKIAQRQKLMTQQYAQLPEDEKEKDRVVARAMLQAITGGQQNKFDQYQQQRNTPAKDSAEYVNRQANAKPGDPIPPPFQKGVTEEFNGEYDDEAGMAQGNLYTIAKAAQGLIDTIDDHDNLPEWAQEKIAKAEGMLVGVWNYLQSQKAQGIDPQISEEFDLIESIINQIADHNGVDADVVWEDLESLTEDELYAFAVTSQLNEDWQKANKKDRTAGMSQKAVNAYRRENPGSKLKTAVTTKPSKLKKGSKASKRRKSYCSRSKGQMKMHNISCAKTPDKAICKARRRWNC